MRHYITLEAGKESKKHYENFPVATFLFPKKLRNAATILYLFARNADDIADEGNTSKKQRLINVQLHHRAIARSRKLHPTHRVSD